MKYNQESHNKKFIFKKRKIEIYTTATIAFSIELLVLAFLLWFIPDINSSVYLKHYGGIIFTILLLAYSIIYYADILFLKNDEVTIIQDIDTFTSKNFKFKKSEIESIEIVRMHNEIRNVVIKKTDKKLVSLFGSNHHYRCNSTISDLDAHLSGSTNSDFRLFFRDL
ncbi:hypothetical protein [Alteromonas ponticola]|uniref:PH domain-containing protein n=1 Tax=Alteromonas ponticola TaxID=2720613 RepID=A0ABX1R2S7_9ALTE|nr:hypothetical protein [Alteromonas ponticola]NMH59926.1 hypothetical protein [Alteromonas ponticola]